MFCGSGRRRSPAPSSARLLRISLASDTQREPDPAGRPAPVRVYRDLRRKDPDEMRRLVICVLAVLTGSPRTAGPSVWPRLLPAAGGAASAHLMEGPGNDKSSQSTRHPANWEETPSGSSGSIRPGPAEAASEATSADLPAPPVPGPEGGAPLTRDAPIAFSSPPSTDQPPSESLVTAAATRLPLTSVTAGGPAGPAQQDVPPLLNVGDEDTTVPRPSPPLDPLLAGLMSVFIVTTAIFFVILFLRFRQRTSHPEFHRLQDLPMDDLMEDTPLSRFSH